jgi:hypothetical protein
MEMIYMKNVVESYQPQTECKSFQSEAVKAERKHDEASEFWVEFKLDRKERVITVTSEIMSL